jgi:YfiH family protein
MASSPPFLTHPAFAFPDVAYGFFTREGGVSEGLYATLNCSLSSKDAPENVRENRARVAAALGAAPERLLSCYQIHSSKAVTALAPWHTEDRPQGDALVTNQSGLALAIGTADCGAVLLHDPVAGVIGAAHAGWKGTAGSIIKETVAAMQALGAAPKNIHAVIGACIQQASYEVGPEFPAPFLAKGQDYMDFFVGAPKAGHFLFDLPAAITYCLGEADVTRVQSLGVDTYSDPRFFSHRRRTHKGEPDMGTMLSAIMLTKGR